MLTYYNVSSHEKIWISPVVKNIDGFTGWGEAFHGYWAQDISRLNPHFGTAADLSDLSDALHARGMVRAGSGGRLFVVRRDSEC